MAEKKSFFSRLGDAFMASNMVSPLRVLWQGSTGQFFRDVRDELGKLRGTGHAAESDWQKDKTHVANISGRGDGVVLANSFRQVSKREPQGTDHDASIGSYSTRNPYEAHTETRPDRTVARGGFDFGGTIDKLIAAFGAVIGIGTAYAHEPLPAKPAAPAVIAQADEIIDPQSGAITKRYNPREIEVEKLPPPPSQESRGGTLSGGCFSNAAAVPAVSDTGGPAVDRPICPPAAPAPAPAR